MGQASEKPRKEDRTSSAGLIHLRPNPKTQSVHPYLHCEPQPIHLRPKSQNIRINKGLHLKTQSVQMLPLVRTTADPFAQPTGC